MSTKARCQIGQLPLLVVASFLALSSLSGCGSVADAKKRARDAMTWSGCAPLMCAAQSFQNGTHDFADVLVEGIRTESVSGQSCAVVTSEKCHVAVANMTTSFILNLVKMQLGLSWADVITKFSTFVTDFATPEMKVQSCELTALSAFVKATNLKTSSTVVTALDAKKQLDDKMNTYFAAIEKAKPVAKGITRVWNLISSRARGYIFQAVNASIEKIPDSFYESLKEKGAAAQAKVTTELSKEMQTNLADPMVTKLNSWCPLETQASCSAKAKAAKEFKGNVEEHVKALKSKFQIPNISLPELSDVNYASIDLNPVVSTLMKKCIRPLTLLKSAATGASCPSAVDLWTQILPLLTQLIAKLKEHDRQLFDKYLNSGKQGAASLCDKLVAELDVGTNVCTGALSSLQADILKCRPPAVSTAATGLRQSWGASVMVGSFGAVLATATGAAIVVLRQRRGSATVPLLSEEVL